MSLILVGIAAAAVVLSVGLVLAFAWRVVVPTNIVHIVQSSKKTTSYGAGSASGNTYYNIPSFVPVFGVNRITLPINNFSIPLHAYEAYDKDRAPFELDLIGFFVVTDTNLAASRCASFDELKGQLMSIMQGAARTILARHDINEIMGDRATFGKAFTDEVDHGLTAWGVQTVKSLELMDIRDAKASKIIADIMAKKSSKISMESRTTVAENGRLAQLAEIEANQAVEVRKQEQIQQVGQRKAEQEREVGIANERSKQQVQAEAKTTKEREMAVAQVQAVKQAEINKEAAIISAEQQRQTQVISAQAQRAVQVTEAEGERDALTLKAAGVRAEGEAKGAAKLAVDMVPITTQVALAKEIGENKEYQHYLVTVEQIKANKEVGVANAAALDKAEVRVIVNSGNVQSGISTVTDLISSKGGTAIAGLLEGLAGTEAGESLVKKLTGK
jgi:flotillin